MTSSSQSPIRGSGQVLRLPAVLAKTGLSRSTLYALLARREFVRPVQLSARTIGFLEDEVDAWIEARAAMRAA